MRRYDTNKPLFVYGLIVTAVCLWLFNDNQNKQERLEEEIEIKYEYSVMIDSLQTELHNTKHWYEMTEEEIQHKDN